jgi:hypothetical protein
MLLCFNNCYVIKKNLYSDFEAAYQHGTSKPLHYYLQTTTTTTTTTNNNLS